MREIVATAGVTVPVFYRQFSTKDELLGDIATEEIRQLSSLLRDLLYKMNSQASADAICDYVHGRRAL